jgi:hypothetical protein
VGDRHRSLHHLRRWSEMTCQAIHEARSRLTGELIAARRSRTPTSRVRHIQAAQRLLERALESELIATEAELTDDELEAIAELSTTTR